MTDLNQQFVAVLEKSPSKGGWTFVVMLIPRSSLALGGWSRCGGLVDGVAFQGASVARRWPPQVADQGGPEESSWEGARGPGDCRAPRKARAERQLMSAAEIDAYLAQLEEPKRSTLSQLRRDILAALPDAQQCISYAVPAFKVCGKQSPASPRSRTT